MTRLLDASVNEVARAGALTQLRLEVPSGWRPALPGQFAMLRSAFSSVFLPRAFSVHGQEGAGAQSVSAVSFLIADVGPGSHELASASVGAKVQVLGPLGRGFPLDEIAEAAGRGSGRLLLVGGGCGLAPFPLLLENLPDTVGEVVVLLGFGSASEAAAAAVLEPALAAARLGGVESRVIVTAEEPGLPRTGLVTDLLAEELAPGDVAIACGPHSMCEAVWGLCLIRGGVPAWFSLEASMACGVGSCHACVIELGDGSLARVCRRGPVFPGEVAFGGRS